MEIVDLTQPLGPGTPRSSDHPPVTFTSLRHYSTDGSFTNEVHASIHAGTHVDAAKLYSQSGVSVDLVPLADYCGLGTVVDVSELGDWGVVTADMLEAAALPGIETIGLYTGWGHYYSTDEQRYILKAPGLDKSGIDWVVSKGIKAIYSDNPSAEHIFMRSRQWKTRRPDIFATVEIDPARFPPSYGHKTMLRAGVQMVENCSAALAQFVGVRVTLAAFPIPYVGVEAAPARVVAFPNLAG